MRKIQFDSEGLTRDCPASDIGNQTSSECQTCLWFGGFVGFDAKCAYVEPDVTETLWAKIRSWLRKIGRFCV